MLELQASNSKLIFSPFLTTVFLNILPRTVSRIISNCFQITFQTVCQLLFFNCYQVFFPNTNSNELFMPCYGGKSFFIVNSIVIIFFPTWKFQQSQFSSHKLWNAFQNSCYSRLLIFNFHYFLPFFMRLSSWLTHIVVRGPPLALWQGAHLNFAQEDKSTWWSTHTPIFFLGVHPRDTTYSITGCSPQKKLISSLT